MGVRSQLTEKTGQPVPASAGNEEALLRREEDGPSQKVLVVDDDEAVLDAIAGLLTSWGYEVVPAKDGAEALPLLLAEDGPCMAVLDWMMPGMNGPEICRLIRATRTARYIYTILVTARGQRQDLIEGLGAGADDYLTKPLDPLELRARLEAGSRIMAQRALRQSEARFHSAFECAGVGMAILHPSGQWFQVNRALCDFLGYTKQELLATTFQAITHPDDLANDLISHERLLSGELGTYQTEKRYIHKNRNPVWAMLTVSPVSGADGKPAYFVTQIQDITARKLAEGALRVAHAESELFINSVPSILIGTDASGRITRWNLTAATTFGLAEPAVRGKPLQACGIHWLDSGIKSAIDSWLQGEGSRKVENISFEKDGERHFLSVTIDRVKFPNEKSAGLLITGADTTERKHLELQLRQAQKLEAIGQLAAGIAHEINTPTQYVSDNTRFLKESWAVIHQLLRLSKTLQEEAAGGAISERTIAELSRSAEMADLDYLLEEIPRAIEQSLEGVQRVAKIVRAMKEFSHPGAEEKRAIDINKAIETTITVARNEWKYVSEVETHFDENLPTVLCHAGEFNQVILNLIINSAHAIAQVVGDGASGKGKITIATRHEADWVEISVGDTGTGIPEEIRSRIFEPFFTTKPVGKGTGQGLALAHAVVVRRHGGSIWFDTEVGKGTTFYIRLPQVAATSG